MSKGADEQVSLSMSSTSVLLLVFNHLQRSCTEQSHAIGFSVNTQALIHVILLHRLKLAVESFYSKNIKSYKFTKNNEYRNKR